MQLIKDIEPRLLMPGITGHYAHGTSMSFGYIELEQGSSIPLHQHVHEQVTYVLEGELDMVIGEQACLLTPGMYQVIPSNIPHSAIAKAACKVIDVFSPAREDYKK